MTIKQANTRLKKSSLYLVGAVSTLTSVGAIFVLVALSAAFLSYSPDGEASSALQTVFYLGVGVTGLLGGWILQRCSFVQIGVAGPLACAVIALWLATLGRVTPTLGLAGALVMYMLSGIDHPNNIRFYREVLPAEQTAKFFSLVQGVGTLFAFSAPVAAGYLVDAQGYRTALWVAFWIYLVSILPWFVVWRLFPSSLQPIERQGIFIGFHALVKEVRLRRLNLARLLTNLAYVPWMTALPVVLARYAMGDSHTYARALGWGNGLLCGAFALTSLSFGIIFRTRLPLIFMSWAASLVGVVSVVCLLMGFTWIYFVYLSAIAIGFGTYCFRISGMTVGQILTPKHLLAPVIVAGDSVVRIWSFAISALVVSLAGFNSLVFALAASSISVIALSALVFMPSLTREACQAVALAESEGAGEA